MEQERPKVGVGILVLKDDKVLLARRKGRNGQGFFGSGGGHLENLESFTDCARREIKEEAGIEVLNLRFLCLSNFVTKETKHYVDIGLVADWQSGEPEVREPDKFEDWDWYDLDNLPTPLWKVVENYIVAYKTGKNYFDSL